MTDATDYSSAILYFISWQLPGILVGALIGALVCYILVKNSERQVRKQALGKSRVVLKGKIGEQMAPLLPGFRHNPADARFIGSPIDYVIFDGYSEAKDGCSEIRKIVLMDVKTGNAKLSPVEKKVRDAVIAGAVEWETLELD